MTNTYIICICLFFFVLVDLLRSGYTVRLLSDGISSQNINDRDAALTRMINAGVILTSAESAIYELMNDAKHAKFKEMLPIVKEYAAARSKAKL